MNEKGKEMKEKVLSCKHLHYKILPEFFCTVKRAWQSRQKIFTIPFLKDYLMLNSRAVNATPCPVFELRGAPRARGRAYGESARAMIHALITEHFAFLEFSAAHILGAALSREQILRVSDEYLPACERFAPDLVDEVRGIAEGSNVPFREIFSLNTFIDIADMVRPETAANYLSSNVIRQTSIQSPSPVTRHSEGGCTSFGAMPPATRDGKIYLGQTFDTKAVFEPYVCALEIRELEIGDSDSDCIVATFAGMVGCAGINAHGVGVVINHLHTRDARPGVPFTFAVRKMLQAKNAEEAIKILSRGEPASGIHYLVADENILRSVETSATKFSLLEPRDGILSHANHCDAHALQEIEIEPSTYSLCRGNRANEMLATRVGQIDANALIEIACDHNGDDDTICSHAEVDAPRLRQYKTDFAMILDTKERGMELFVGSPCERKALSIEV